MAGAGNGRAARLGALVVALLATGFVPAAPALARGSAPTVVTTTGDASSASQPCEPGPCSLRAAIEEASTTVAGGGSRLVIDIPAGSYALNPALGNLRYAPAQRACTGTTRCNLDIRGAGRALTRIDCGGLALVALAAGARVAITGVQLTDGCALAAGTGTALTLSDALLANDPGVVALADGPLVLRHVETSHIGSAGADALVSATSVRVERSFLHDDVAGRLVSAPAVAVLQSTFAGEDIDTAGGTTGLLVDAGRLTAIGSAFVGTTFGTAANRAVLNVRDPARSRVDFDTITGDVSRGGRVPPAALNLAALGALRVAGVVVGAGDGVACAGEGVPVIDARGAPDLFEPRSTCVGLGVPGGRRRAGLDSSGMPLARSPVVNAAGRRCTLARLPGARRATDIRGVPRPSGPGCDIGAFEAALDLVPTVRAAASVHPGGIVHLVVGIHDIGRGRYGGTQQAGVVVELPRGFRVVSTSRVCIVRGGAAPSVGCVLGALAPGGRLSMTVVARAGRRAGRLAVVAIARDADARPANDTVHRAVAVA